MTPNAPKIRSIFLAAVESVEPDRWATYLDEQCHGDAELRRQVEILLQAHQEANSLLDARPVEAPIDAAPYHTLPLDASADQSLPFMGKPTQDSATMDAERNEDDGPSPLEILQPSTKPGSLGRLGHYEVLEVLGQGGFGTVVRAYDEKLHRMIAIKIMAPRLAATSPARKRFMREARSSAAIRHENVVDIHAIEEQPTPFLVMEYVAGETLQQRLDRVGPLDTLEVLRIGVQIARGLAAAHAMGKIHRDIKPANILLENGVDRVKITDFGLARAADDASLTQSGLIAGTPMYMAPEQAQGVALDHRADLFSFGSVLYVMCSGRPPFRASTTLAVLKRVAEDTPRPIREIIPEVPEWLCDIVTKLHAKNPSERYQSAQEVADVLSKYLNELQAHGKVQSVVAATPNMASEPTPAAAPHEIVSIPPEPPRRRRRLVVAAAVLLCFVVGLAFTEATGVTELRSAVIRFFVPDGTLLVECNDPGVKVTVERDDGLVITGAGLDEIPLRPGNYKVQAERNGKPVMLDRELVSLATEGREVVKVKLESPPAPVVAKPDKGAFVLLAAGKERKFDTLAEAVLSSSDGDIIEVRGNGPFVSDGTTVRHSLVIRAGAGYSPSITQGTINDRTKKLTAVNNHGGVLVLEGLQLEGRFPLFTTGNSGALHVANCRLNFKIEGPGRFLFASSARFLFVRNSILSTNFENNGVWFFRSGGRCNIDNCVTAIGGLQFSRVDTDVTDVSVCIRRNTFVGNCLNLWAFNKPKLPADGGAGPPLRLELSGNVASWDGTARGFLCFHPPQEHRSADQAEALLLRLVHLDEKQNVYRTGTPMLSLASGLQPLKGKRGQDLADWDRFWGRKNTGSVEGDVHFQGGDLSTRARAAPEQLTAEDFRLRPDSAGYKAGKDGKDLGADVDLVGPGPAYERWKKTPDYQNWRKDTGQKK